MVSSDTVKSLLPNALHETSLSLPGKESGKVRDWYPFGSGRRLLVTTDRLSAFDRVLAAVPFKGQVLNQISAWWFEQTKDLIRNHLISTPDPNASVVHEVRPIPVEVVVRGYITGVTSTALWYRYSLGEREIYGHRFPEGLHKNEALPEPIITPTTKGGPTGHDERLTCAEVVDKGLLEAGVWEALQSTALTIFKRGQEVAARSGLILVDTKYEFGMAPDGSVMLIDEVHTPDSSRFWRTETYAQRLASGDEPENFDKEFVRIAYAQRGYRGDGPPPAVDEILWIMTSQLYITIYESLTGQKFDPGRYPVQPRLIENLRMAGYEL